MTSSITALGQSQVAPEVSGQTDAPTAPRSGSAESGAESASSAEAVTLSPDAQTTTQLLGAARSASGMNEQAVAQLRASIQNGTYDVSPDTLARSITNAVKEASP
jgi:flagellar biosynthesis anti-sigma factor FlgM